jgi:hypothetical protein
MSNARRVSYFYDAEVGNYHYGQGRAMIPGSIGTLYQMRVLAVVDSPLNAFVMASF